MPEPLSQEAMFAIDQQTCVVKDFDAQGWILDLGGGGEGIIGRLKGSHVIAIDIKKEELTEAPAGPLKIIMDATNLQFLDNSFHTVTAFFSFMYFARDIRLKVFQEVSRVLAPGGKFYLWDVTIPPATDPSKRVFIVPLTIQLPHEQVQTGYGVRWQGHEHTLEDYGDLAQQTGFKIKTQQTTDHLFYAEFQK